MSEKNSNRKQTLENQQKPNFDTPTSETDAEKTGGLFEDLSQFKLPQNFDDLAAVKPVLTVIPVRKPHRQEFIRVRPGDEWQMETGGLKDQESGEVYLVPGSLWQHLPGEIKPMVVFLVMTRNSKVPFLWPCTIPDPEKPNRWHQSAMDAARLAQSQWVQVKSDTTAGCYLSGVPMTQFPEPEWPENTFSELLELGFRDQVITSLDHPFLRRLRGDA